MRRLIYTSLIALVLLGLVLVVPAGAAPARADRGAWAPNVAYAVGDTVTYGGSTYKCLQAHTSQIGWEPPNVPALWQLTTAGPTATRTNTPAGPTATRTRTPTVGGPTATRTNTPAGPTATRTRTPTVGGPTATRTPTPISGGGTTGTVNFHLMLGVGAAQDKLTLDGDNYTDLIMSNLVAGVHYGHLLNEWTPGLQYNKDYLYGSIWGQLLQENLATYMYQASSNLIDPAPEQQAVMGTGQGGPYQINNYVPDMVAPGSGHALVNYVAIQKNIGFTIAGMNDQLSKVTPPSFNNKYYGPILTAYFHYNDAVALNLIGKGAGGWQTPWQPAYDNCVAHAKTLPNNFFEIVLNVAYNQGFYGGLVNSYSTTCATATAATVASVNSYTSVWGKTSSYEQYPYQVRYYLDQIYGNPIPTTSATTLVPTGNHVFFNMTKLGSVFSSVYQTLAYVNGSGQYVFISAAQASAAYSSALSQAGVSASANLDLSSASSRAQIFSVLEKATANLETSLATNFSATTLTQLQ